MRKLVLRFVLLTLFASIFFFPFAQNEASAMPGFARKYGSPCSSCHIAYPKLNSFGIAFKQRGYRMEDEGPGENVWKMKDIPIGAIAQVAIEAKREGGAKTSRADVNAVEFFFGGVLGPNVSFFGDFGADFDKETGEFESLTPDVAFVVFDDIISYGRMNIKFGQMDVDFPFLSDPRAPTLAGYLTRLDAGGEDGVTLGRKAVELNGFFEETNTRYGIGVGNTAVENAENSIGAIHAWATQTAEVIGFEQTLGVMVSLDKNGDEIAKTDDNTTVVGLALDLHYGLSGLILAYYDYSGNTTTAEADVSSGLAELLHSFAEDIVGVARYDFQDTDGSTAEKSQVTVGLQYFVLPNVKAQAEAVMLKETNAAGSDKNTYTSTVAVTFGF